MLSYISIHTFTRFFIIIKWMKNNINNLIVNSLCYNVKNNHKLLFDSYQFKTKNQKYKF